MLTCVVGAWAQSSSNSPASSSGAGQTPSSPSSSSSSSQSSTSAKKPSRPSIADLAPPRSDSVNAEALPEGESSSKDTQIDLSPPAGDDKAHPQGDAALVDEEVASGTNDVGEFHVFDPHKAAKDVEVGDYYFKLKNYIGAESRYREALVYKDKDAVATYRLAVCLEKMSRLDESRQEFESYLKILPSGPQAADAKKALARLDRAEAKAK
jgi:tetratricopeptide (TPR) repeat protein